MPATKSQEVGVMDLDQVKTALLDRKVKLTIVDEDPEVAQRRMVEQTLSATSLDQIWSTGATHAEDCIDRAFELTSVDFRNSEIEDAALGIFAVMHVTFLDTGELTVVTSGAAGIVTRLVKIVEFGACPIRVKIRATKTKKGYTALDLALVSTDGF